MEQHHAPVYRWSGVRVPLPKCEDLASCRTGPDVRTAPLKRSASYGLLKYPAPILGRHLAVAIVGQPPRAAPATTPGYETTLCTNKDTRSRLHGLYCNCSSRPQLLDQPTAGEYSLGISTWNYRARNRIWGNVTGPSPSSTGSERLDRKIPGV